MISIFHRKFHIFLPLKIKSNSSLCSFTTLYPSELMGWSSSAHVLSWHVNRHRDGEPGLEKPIFSKFHVSRCSKILLLQNFQKLTFSALPTLYSLKKKFFFSLILIIPFHSSILPFFLFFSKKSYSKSTIFSVFCALLRQCTRVDDTLQIIVGILRKRVNFNLFGLIFSDWNWKKSEKKEKRRKPEKKIYFFSFSEI